MIIGVNGGLRQGKGIFMMYWVMLQHRMGLPTIANFSIKLSTCRKINFLDYLKLVGGGRVEKPTLLILDEVQTWIDSRSAQSKFNKFGGYVLDQSAKLGYTVIYSSQRFGRADIELRMLTDVRFIAEKRPYGFRYNRMKKNAEHDIPTGQSFCIPFSVARSYWHLYDTYEAVKPVGFDNLVREIERTQSYQ